MRNDKVKSLSVGGPRQASTLHVETPLGIVNIYCGVSDHRGREVVSVELLPDQYAGSPLVLVDGYVQTRMVRTQVKLTGTRAGRGIYRTVQGMLGLLTAGRAGWRG